MTNVNTPATRYMVSVLAPAGTTVTVSPAVAQLRPGRSATLTITIIRTTAALNAYPFGSLTWTPQTQSGVLPSAARIPIAVQLRPLVEDGDRRAAPGARGAVLGPRSQVQGAVAVEVGHLRW